MSSTSSSSSSSSSSSWRFAVLEAVDRGVRAVSDAAGVDWVYEVVLAALLVVHVVVAPFTKVEESFNIQAMHDMLVHGTDLDAYDHHQFPGVVPRTFVGAAVVALLSYVPFVVATAVFGLRKVAGLYICRAVLAALYFHSYRRLAAAFAERFGVPSIYRLCLALGCAQFHLLFYASRTLPNTFAMIVVNWAVALWLLHRYAYSLFLLVLAASVFRCDTIILALPILLVWLLRRRMTLAQLVYVGVVSSVMCVSASAAFDTLMWQRPLWPEWEVLWFNTVENKSSQWGTSPWHWYVTSAIPKALLGALLLVPLALVRVWPGLRRLPTLRLVDVPALFDADAIEVLTPVVVFVGLYSFLPHKELRFLFPALPTLNGLAAVGAARLLQRKDKSPLPWLFAMALIATGLFAGLGMLYVSSHNYPGGHAMSELHRLAQPSDAGIKPVVHVDNLAAISGVSRFLEHNDRFVYSKEEHLTDEQLGKFDYLINERPHVGEQFEKIGAVAGLDRVSVRKRAILMRPALFVYYNKKKNSQAGGKQ